MILLLLLGCADDAGKDTGRAPVETGRDSAETGLETGRETGETDQDSAETGDSAKTALGLLTWSGSASVAEGWAGEESVLLLGDMGLGEARCAIDYAVSSTASREDCAECALAYDVVLGAPTTRVSTDCAAAGYDEATIGALEGQTRSYGFALDYLGHSNVLMLDDGGVWKAVAFVDWDEDELQLRYAWEQGYVPYTP